MHRRLYLCFGAYDRPYEYRGYFRKVLTQDESIMDPEQIILDNNDFDDGSDYGEYEFMQDQDALSLNAPLDHQ